MCGIFCLIDPREKFASKENLVENEFIKGRHRGPEFSILQKYDFVSLGFHRLAINGLNSQSNQPIEFGDIVLICNGEIYNYKSLYKLLNIIPKTDSDCEVIIYLYLKFGLDYTLQLLDGVFSFCLYDKKTNTVCMARDPLGIRPLYYTIIDDIIVYASELKMINQFYQNSEDSEYKIIHSFPPGCYSYYNYEDKQLMETVTTKYYNFSFSSTCNLEESLFDKSCLLQVEYNHFKPILKKLKDSLIEAVIKRIETTDRPIACLLSGGLDSSLIASIVNNYLIKNGKPPVETYSIGLKNSVDLKYAKIAADYIETKHTEIEITEEDFFNAIPEVIKAIESYDTTTVRASVGNYLVAKYIKQHSNAKVIFNGDGADELMGGYLYMHMCPSDIEFDYECKRLLRNIHFFDVLRSDKCISSHGLEARTPFLDRTFVQTYLSLHPSIRNPKNRIRRMEKWLIRQAFLNVEKNEDCFLPKSILLRKKEAFSDGVSSQQKSWYQIINENIPEEYKDLIDNNFSFNTPQTPEQFYYRSIFEKHYPNIPHVIPYFWMPKYVETTDSSARTLKIYNDCANQEYLS